MIIEKRGISIAGAAGRKRNFEIGVDDLNGEGEPKCTSIQQTVWASVT